MAPKVAGEESSMDTDSSPGHGKPPQPHKFAGDRVQIHQLLKTLEVPCVAVLFQLVSGSDSC